MSKQTTRVLFTIFLTVIAMNVMAISFDSKVDYPAGVQPKSVFSADFDGDGDMDVACANISGNNISVMLNDGTGNFSAKVDYPTGGSNPYSVFAVDLFGDGDYDLLAANGGSDDVGLLVNNGDGTFAPAVIFGSIQEPTAVCAADLDNNGFADVIVAASGDADAVCIILNYGNGAFGIPAYYDAANGIYSVCTGDFDQDGDIDVASANFLGGANDVSVFMNDGNGAFGAAVHYSAGSNARYITTADFDGNGYEDLAIANVGSDDISILMNNNDGTFTDIGSYSAGIDPNCIFAADMDGDGDYDLVAPSAGDNTVIVMKNYYGDGSYFTSSTFTTGDSPVAVFGADFDNDDDIDLVVGNNQTHNVSILINQATFIEFVVPPHNELNVSADINIGIAAPNSLLEPTSISNSSVVVHGSQTGFHPVTSEMPSGWLAIFDPTDDFKPGEVVSVTLTDAIQPLGGSKTRSANGFLNPGVLQFTVATGGDGTGTFDDPVNYGENVGDNDICAADLNNDGNMDLVTIDNFYDRVSVLINNGDGTFLPEVNYTSGDGPRSIVSGDFNNDGDIDLAMACWSDLISVLNNNGDGTFQTAVNYSIIGGHSISAADFNADGYIDLVSGGFNREVVSILINNGDGTFPSEVTYGVSDNPNVTIPADFDRDGDIDLIVEEGLLPNLVILRNKGDGTFQKEPINGINYSDLRLKFAADFDDDGNIDLVFTAYDESDNPILSILKNNGDGSFASTEHYDPPVATGHSGLASDFDGDGDLDMVFTNFYFNNIALMKNNGDGTFMAPIYKDVSGPISVCAADFDGDGDIDLATANYDPTNVSILFNNPPAWICGDVDDTGEINILDIVFLINYKYKGQAAPDPMESGDVNNTGTIDILDIVHMINYKYKDGDPPNCP